MEDMLTIYDAINYAPNAAEIPIIAYSGEIDAQRLAATNIEKRLKELGLSQHMTHLIGPGLRHEFPPAWQKKVEEKLGPTASQPRPAMPASIDFTTFTLRTASCEWARIDTMDRHYRAATVAGSWTGTTFVVKTQNVRGLTLSVKDPTAKDFPTSATLDGQAVPCSLPENKTHPVRTFVLADGKWRMAKANDDDVPQKRPTVQGPIDDAFTQDFVCIVGTGPPANLAMHAAALAQLEHFQREWDKNFRGTLRVVKDTDFKPADESRKTWALFGDPGSNPLIAGLLPKLPIRWTAKELIVNGVSYSAESHVPMMVYPDPARPQFYIVLNSGHTFQEAEFKGTNAQLYPRLGDFAVAKPTPTAKAPAAFEVIDNGLFDEFWKFPKK